MSSYLLALDLGTAQIKALVAKIDSPDNWQVVFPSLRQSQGVKQGMISDIDLLATELNNVLTEMEGANRNFIFKQAIVGVGGPHLETRISKGVSVISRPDGEITEDDKERALKAAQACVLPANRVLTQTTVQNYIIDGSTKVKDPLTMKGLRLETECLLIDSFTPVIRNIDRLGEMLGLSFNKIILPYAGAELALTHQDKELGAAVLDLGAGTTSLCLYEDNDLLDLKVFPIGGNNITNDIAVGLKTYVDLAEKIKIQEGVALAKKITKGAMIDLNQYFGDSEEENKISKRFLAEIIEARLSEIFDMVSERLKELDKFGKLPGGIVLLGGGAQMPYIVDLAKEKFKLPVRIAKPAISWYDERPDPSFIPVLGLIDLAIKNSNETIEGGNFFAKIIKNIKHQFLP
ncbi:MAG: cell division protein FtsA [Minisyncoccia bacterium]